MVGSLGVKLSVEFVRGFKSLPRIFIQGAKVP